MDAADAHAIMAVLHAEWPAGEWIDDDGDLTVRGAMFALEFESYLPEDGVEAARRMRGRIPYRQGPQTADIRATLREVALERELEGRAKTYALPSGEPVAWGDEAAAILKQYFDKVGDPLELRVKRAAALGDPEAKDKAGRLLAQKQIEQKAAKTDAAAPIAPTREPVRVQPVTACGVRWNTPLVKERGSNRWVCPNCGRTPEEGCEAS